MTILRDYQQQAIAHLKKQWAAGLTRVPMVLSTGAGKTVIFTAPDLLNEYLNDNKRVLIIAHTDELIEQAARKARAAHPHRRVGIVKASVNQCTAEIIVSSRQTLGHATGGPRRLAQMRNVGLIIIDEAHHALRTNTYGKILEHFKCFEDDEPCGHPCRTRGAATCLHRCCHDQPHPVKVAGFTATLARGDKGKLSTVWETGDDGVFRRDILYFIRRGYLLDVRGERIVIPDFDMGNVRQSAGDFRDGDIADELERTFAPEIVAREYAARALGPDGQMRKGIAFWPLVDTAYHGAKAFNEMGIRSEVIHGQLPKLERRALLQRLHTGETQVVHGVGVLTEGFDEPTVDVVVMARPTRSAPLYQQMVGRVLRPDLTIPADQRQKALILDVVGSGAQHDLRSLVDLSPERPLRTENPDLSLLELDEDLIEWEKEAAAGGSFELDGAEDYRGETVVVEFDPLHRQTVWSQTPAGTYFMSAGSVAYVILVDSIAGDPGTYDVVLCSKPGRGIQPWAKATEHVAQPLDMALGWAEDVAVQVGGEGTKTLVSKKSKWRKDEPNLAQQRLAEGLGINYAGMTKGEISEAIDNVKAARRIDPLVGKVKAAMK